MDAALSLHLAVLSLDDCHSDQRARPIHGNGIAGRESTADAIAQEVLGAQTNSDSLKYSEDRFASPWSIRRELGRKQRCWHPEWMDVRSKSSIGLYPLGRRTRSPCHQFFPHLITILCRSVGFRCLRLRSHRTSIEYQNVHFKSPSRKDRPGRVLTLIGMRRGDRIRRDSQRINRWFCTVHRVVERVPLLIRRIDQKRRSDSVDPREPKMESSLQQRSTKAMSFVFFVCVDAW